MSDPTPWQPGHVIDGRFELIELIGIGGMGVVWRVHHREWDRELALKMPLPALLSSPIMRERFVREAETWIGLGVHPHIVQCWFVQEIHGLPSLFLDFLTGGSLKNWMDNGHVRPGQWELILAITMQVAEGLAYAHSKGVIHRDIKPENLLIRGDERICVTDFGIVKTAVSENSIGLSGLSHQLTSDAGVTGAGGYLGTPQYGAPEQWGAAERVGPAADLYALGVTLFEMCCGRRPFDAPGETVDVHTLIERHLSEPVPDPREFRPDVPKEIAELCQLMMHKEPAGRPPQMLLLRQMIDTIYARIAGHAYRPAAPLLGVQSPEVLNNQAVSLYSLGKIAEALEAVRRGLRIESSHPECLYNLVQIEKRQGRIGYQEGLRRLKQARANYPLALLLIEEGMAREAVGLLKAISPAETSSPGLVLRALGDALMFSQQQFAAQRAYAEALVVMPKDEATAARKLLATVGERELDGAILFPSPEPTFFDRSADTSIRLLLDHAGGGIVGLTASGAVYLELEERQVVAEEERHDSGPPAATWISGKRLLIADPAGFEFRLVPSLRLLTRRKGRVLACAPLIDRIVTLEDNGPHLFVVEKGKFEPIAMHGQSPDMGPLLASFDPSGQQLCLLLPSGQLAGLDEQNQAVPAAWPSQVEGHKNATCLALTGDGALLIGHASGELQSLELASRGRSFVVRLPAPLVSLEVHARGACIVGRTAGGYILLDRRGKILLSGSGPVAVDPQGRYCLLFHNSRMLLYSLHPLYVLRRWSRPFERPKSVEFSGDGRIALTMGYDGDYQTWEIDEDHRVYERRLLMAPGRGYAEILADGQQFQQSLDLAHSACRGGEFSEAYRHLLRARKVRGYGQSAPALDLGWKILETLGRDKLDALWERQSLEGLEPGPLVLAPNGRHLLFSFANTICLAFDQDAAARPLWTFSCPARVKSLSFYHPGQGDETLVLVVDETGGGGFLSPRDGRLIRSFASPRGPIVCAEVMDTLLTYLTREGGVGQLDLESGSNRYRNDLPDRALLLAPGQGGQAIVVTAGNFGWLDLGKPASPLQAVKAAGQSFASPPDFVRSLPERRLLLLGFASGSLLLVDETSGKLLGSLEHGAGSTVTAFELISELSLALVATTRGHLYFWDLRDNKLLEKTLAHRGGVSALRASTSGRYLLTAGKDGLVRLWETSWSAASTRPGEPAWLSGVKPLDRVSKFLGLG